MKPSLWRHKKSGHIVELVDIAQECQTLKLFALVKKVTEHEFEGEYMASRYRLREWNNFVERFERVSEDYKLDVGESMDRPTSGIPDKARLNELEAQVGAIKTIWAVRPNMLTEHSIYSTFVLNMNAALRGVHLK